MPRSGQNFRDSNLALRAIPIPIIEQKTNFWHAVPGWAALIIFIIILFWLGLMEGLQVALVELKRVDIEQFR